MTQDLKSLINPNVVGLKIISTYKCNQRCKFCYQQTFNSIDLDLEIFKERLLEVKKHYYPVFITLQGGEHTILPNWVEYVKIASSIFPHSKLSVTTNGTACLREYNEAVNAGLCNISFSINKVDMNLLYRATDLARQGNTTVRFNVVLDYENLDFLKSIYNTAFHNKINLNICSNVLVEDKRAFDAVRDLLKSDDFDHPLPHVTRFFVKDYTYWLHHYAPEGYNQLYILPDGSYSISNQDVVEGKGAF